MWPADGAARVGLASLTRAARQAVQRIAEAPPGATLASSERAAAALLRLARRAAYARDYRSVAAKRVPLARHDTCLEAGATRRLRSWGFHAAASARHALYHRPLLPDGRPALRPSRLPLPVVSVGNATWGGAGKTPMALLLSRLLADAGAAPLLLTRGYRRAREPPPRSIERAREGGQRVAARSGGDEARMLAAHLRGSAATVLVGHDRERLARDALAAAPPGRYGAIVLDDGLQYHSLERNLDVVMGSGHIVPRGPLREPPERALRRADVVVLHNWDCATAASRAVAATEVTALAPPGALLLRSLAELTELVPIGGSSDAKTDPALLRGAHVICLTGVACPDAVAASLRAAGAARVETIAVGDHEPFTSEDYGELARRVRAAPPGAPVLAVTTEKDYHRDAGGVVRGMASAGTAYVACAALRVTPLDADSWLDGGDALELLRSRLLQLLPPRQC